MREARRGRGAMDSLIIEFLQECTENLDRLDQDFVKLESNPSNLELLQSIFRTIHTIKGTCGFWGFTQLEAVAHVGENLLSLLRDGVIRMTPERTTTLLSLADAIRQILDTIEKTESEGERDDAALIAVLKRLQKDEPSAGEPQAEPEREPQGLSAVASTEQTASGQKQQGPEKDKGTAPEAYLGEAVKLLGKIFIDQGLATPEEVESAIQKQLEGDGRSLGEILTDRGVVKPQEVITAIQVQQTAKSIISEAAIRVDVTLLDRLMNLVGELVLARNQIVQHTQNDGNNTLVASSQRLNLITTELQECVMKTRMHPIGNIWSKFPRTVRDVAMGCGKQVRIGMEGKETELDKTIIEAIKDPLTHLVRNSVDHGIEMPDKRLAAGKPAEGLLRLRAYHEGGQVNIEISDDGAGLNCEKIRKKAVQRGLIRADQAAHMTEREAVNKLSTQVHSAILQIANTTGSLVSAAEELTATSQQMSANAEETSSQANVVTAASDEVNKNLQTIATATEEMSASIKDIAKNASEAAKVANSAVGVAHKTNQAVTKLDQSSAETGEVLKVITSIAQQTNLLALNATIEAARAGEAGKGFAVVANEVKELVKETAKATEDISRKIESTQTDTKESVEASGTISGVINQISDISTAIASAVEEQNATTNEMTRNVSEVARGSSEITKNIAGVAEAAQSTSHGASDSQKAAHELAKMSKELRELTQNSSSDGNRRVNTAPDWISARAPAPATPYKVSSANLRKFQKLSTVEICTFSLGLCGFTIVGPKEINCMPGYFSPMTPHSKPACMAMSSAGLPKSFLCTSWSVRTSSLFGSGFQPG